MHRCAPSPHRHTPSPRTITIITPMPTPTTNFYNHHGESLATASAMGQPSVPTGSKGQDELELFDDDPEDEGDDTGNDGTGDDGQGFFARASGSLTVVATRLRWVLVLTCARALAAALRWACCRTIASRSAGRSDGVVASKRIRCCFVMLKLARAGLTRPLKSVSTDTSPWLSSARSYGWCARRAVSYHDATVAGASDTSLTMDCPVGV